MDDRYPCWICESDTRLLRRGGIDRPLQSSDFAITDKHYGKIADLFQCSNCGFLQCSRLEDVLGFYENLVDPSYEDGRAVRSMQQRKLLELIPGTAPGRRLLDIGAGSGMLVEEALRLGYEAEGIEPCAALQQTASERGLPVRRGTFPHPTLSGPYDAITMVDVLEHVPNPVGLLEAARRTLSPSGLLLVVTPDVNSIAARLLGSRWWHYRVAHIGYFNRTTLALALRNAGLAPMRWGRPAWYFKADYLAQRVLEYCPSPLRIRPPQSLGTFTLRLNLRDSLYVVCGADHKRSEISK